MQRACAFFLIFALSLAAASQVRLYAQSYASEEESEDEDGSANTDGSEPLPDTDWDTYMPDLYSRGDKTFSMSVGAIFPTVFTLDGEIIEEHNFFPIGGIFSLGISYFFGSHIFLGAEVSGMFNSTLAKHTVYIVPMGVKGGYQFVIGKFEIPLSLMIGGAPQRYLELGYFGLFMKAGASAFYRFFPNWSFGLNAAWGWYPQWTNEPSKNADGHFIDVTLSARYHF